MIYKLLLVLFILGFIYMWNRFVVKFMIKALVGFHKRNNQKNINRQPIKFLVNNEQGIYLFYASLFWFGAVVISYGILIK